MSINQNTPSTFLRTQSYIVNGKPNPNLLSNISRRKFFSNFIKVYDKNQKKLKKTKISIKKNKQYINDIKNQKNKRSSSLHKFNKKMILKQKILSPEREKERENEDFNIVETDSNNLFNNSNKYIEKECSKNNKLKNGNKKEEKNKIDKEFFDTFDNKISDKQINMSIFNSNTFTNINKNNNQNYNKKFCITTENEKNCTRDDILNIFNNNKIFSNTTKFNYHPSRHNGFEYDYNIHYNLTNPGKPTNHKKMFYSLQKDKSLINKILLNDDIDDYINKIRNNNKLLEQLNYYTKRENFVNNNIYIEENKTKEKIKSMKKSIKKMSILNTNPNSKDKYEISKVNEIKNKKEFINLLHYSNNLIRNNIKFINSLNNATYYYNNNINNTSPILTEFNLSNDKKLFEPKIYKDTIKRTLSNVIYAMRDERNTNKFIKELNKNNNKNYNSNKIIRFSFSKDKNEELNDEFYSPLNNRITNIYMTDKEKKCIPFYRTNVGFKKTNHFIQNHTSLDNFRRNSKNKKYKSNFCIINQKLFNYIHGYLNSSNVIMPANQAD